MARNISDADRARARMQITDFERASLEEGRNISDEDRARAEEKYMKRNDGGMAMSGRGKPVRTF